MAGKLFIIVLSLIIFAGFARPVVAVNVSDFGSCANPQITVSQVNTGNNHGVVGRTASYSGVDKIYNFSNGNVMQCLCPDTGKGIQTNWLRVSDVSEKDINILKKQGWKYLVTGSSWGLSDVPYLAKNVEYTCREESKVLAATGVSVAIYGLILAGFTALIAGLLLKRFSK